MRIKHVLRTVTLALAMVGASVLSWYGFVSWGYYAAYVSARIGSTPEAQLHNARIHGNTMFCLLLVGQLGVVVAGGFLFRQYSKSWSRGAAASVSAATAIVIDCAVFAMLFAYQRYTFPH